jgi:hypothetical protein
VQTQPKVSLVRVLVEMVDAFSVEQRRTPLDAMNFIASFKQEFG